MNKKLNQVCLCLMMFMLSLKSTYLNENNIFDKLLILLLGVSTISLLYQLKNQDYIGYFKKNYLLFIYVFFRILSLFLLDNKVDNTKTLIYEVFFLFVISQLYKKYMKTFINAISIIILTNFIINIITMLFKFVGISTFATMLYTNENSMASLTIISLLLFLTFLFARLNKVVGLIYVLFSLIVIYFSESRTPILMIVGYCFIRIILKFKIVKPSMLKKVCLILINIAIAFIILFSYINRNEIVPTKIEEIINDFTTNRYYLWKYSILSLNDSPLLGISGKNIGEKRYEEMPRTLNNFLYGSRIAGMQRNNNHNGYIQLLASNGYICYVIFMLWLFKKCRKISIKKFYIISAILILNMFENEFITSANIHIFLLMYLLNENKSHSKLNI